VSKRPLLCVCPLMSTSLGLAVAGSYAGQDLSTAAQALRTAIITQPSNGRALYKKLSLRHVQANPNAYNVRGDPYRRSQCAV